MVDGHVFEPRYVRDALRHNDGDDSNVGSDEEVKGPTNHRRPLYYLRTHWGSFIASGVTLRSLDDFCRRAGLWGVTSS